MQENAAKECKVILKHKTKTSCMSKNSSKVSNENKQGMLFWFNLPKNGFWGQNFESELILPRYHVCQFSGKVDNFDFFSPNLPKKEFWGQNFKDLNPDPESAPPRYHVSQFSGKTDKFEFFSLNLGKLLNYMRYFSSNNVEGVAESWVEGEMSWVEVDGAGRRWVHGLVIT